MKGWQNRWQPEKFKVCSRRQRSLVFLMFHVRVYAGHGVGAYLNVHEGPQSISYKKRAYEEGLYPGPFILHLLS